MRRFLIVSCLLALIVALSVPCFAVGQSGADDTVYYNSLQFDELLIDGCDTEFGYPCTFSVPFPFNSGLGGSAVSSFSFASGNIHGFQGTATDNSDGIPEIVGDLQLPCLGSTLLAGTDLIEYPAFTLSAKNMVFNLPDINGRWSIVYPFNSLRVVSVEAWGIFDWIKFEDLLDEYISTSRISSYTEAYFPNNVIDVSYVIRKLCEKSGLSGPNYSLSSLTLKFTFRFVANDENPTFTFYNRASTKVPIVAGWFNEYDLPYKVETALTPETDTISWLTSSVEAFLELEIFPDFALNDLFALIVVILLMFWFITLLI